jgi:hypothetical protein
LQNQVDCSKFDNSERTRPLQLFFLNKLILTLGNHNKYKEPREVTRTKNRLSDQNHKNTNPQTKKNETIRDQITTKKINQITPTTKIREKKYINKRCSKQQRTNQSSKTGQKHKGIKKQENKETLTLKNSIRLKVIITMATNHRH